MVHFMAFSCKTGSIYRCLELSATVAALVGLRWSSGLVVSTAQGIYIYMYQLPFWVCLPAPTRGFFKPGRWGGRGLTPQGLFARLPVWKHQNIGLQHSSLTSDPAACEWGPGWLCQGDLQSAGLILSGTTQNTPQLSTSHFLQVFKAEQIFFICFFLSKARIE